MNKKIIIIILAVVVLCCLITVGFGAVFGQFSLNGGCVYKGLLATVDSGPCAENAGSANGIDTGLAVYKGKHASEFTFGYDDTTLVLDDNPADKNLTVVLTAKLYDNFRDNINIVTSAKVELTETNCRAYSQLIPQQLGNVLAIKPGSLGSEITTIRNKQVCHTYWTVMGQTVDFSQNQYIFAKGDKSYILTVSEEVGSFNQAEFNQVVNNFVPLN